MNLLIGIIIGIIILLVISLRVVKKFKGSEKPKQMEIQLGEGD